MTRQSAPGEQYEMRNTSGQEEIASSREPANQDTDYDFPESWENLDEIAAPSPVDEAEGRDTHRRLEQKGQDEEQQSGGAESRGERARKEVELQSRTKEAHVSELATQLYTLSYLVFFAMLGTLARVGLSALTKYPGTPIIFTTIWANVGGSFIMGFLSEDRMLFRHEWGTPTYDQHIMRARKKAKDEENGSTLENMAVDLTAAKKAHLAAKKTIPLYIGLATGFCGSFTSFSTFIKDAFLALSNDMATPGVSGSPTSRNGGYSFLALLGIIITTVCLSLSALFVGAHLAIACESFTPSIPYPVTRKVIDRLFVVLGWGCWLGVVILSIFPPHDVWRGRVLFALVFAPLGCLARFYLALYLNGKVKSFPVGTFVANVAGTVVLGMAWDIAHVPIGGVVGCQVLQGVEDGFCGCLTTVSTWVTELSGLRRRHAYTYGSASVVVALGLMIAIMGGLRWSDGFAALQCSI